MKILGVLLIVLALAIGYTSGSVIDHLWIERVVGIAFSCFLFGIFILIKTRNPPPPPKKCICNDIGEHTPGGRCEAKECYEATNKRLKNPPTPPKKCVGITPHGRLYRPEFPKDRT